jgi:hypothetical protein
MRSLKSHSVIVEKAEVRNVLPKESGSTVEMVLEKRLDRDIQWKTQKRFKKTIESVVRVGVRGVAWKCGMSISRMRGCGLGGRIVRVWFGLRREDLRGFKAAGDLARSRRE